MRKILTKASIVLAAALAFGHCTKEAAQKAKEALGTIKFSGTVKRAGSETPIEGATVRFIELLDLDAVKKLVEVKKVPDGSGGKKDVLRIKLDAVHAFATDHETKTDADGKFKFEAPVSVYLVYTFGPGAEPGAAAAYSVNFWGINGETGELDLDHLIGKDGKREQSNDSILLAGGPLPPPPATPVPTEPAAPAAPTTTPVAVPTEPAVVNTSRPEDVVPPASNATFWTSINLTHKTGTLGTTSKVYDSATALEPVDGDRYMLLTAELGTAQTEPVYLVMQTGFDSTTTPGCETVESSAKTKIFPVQPNGTTVEYKLVSPGPYYKFFFAKTATKEDGKPVDAQIASQALTVGTRDCKNAVPTRPFMATLSWDRESDVDLFVMKFDAEKAAANVTENILVDQANWMRREGTSLTLDVDNVYGFGPENNGEAATELSPEKYCYVVLLNLYAYRGTPVKATVDVTHVVKEGTTTKVRQYQWTDTLDQQGQWKPVGIYGPSACTKLTVTH